MLISAEVSLCMHVVVTEREKTATVLESEHQFSWNSTSRTVWSDPVLLEEFSQSQMFRLLLLLENTYVRFASPFDAGQMAQKLDVQSRVHCTSQQMSLRRTVDHCQIRSSQAGPT